MDKAAMADRAMRLFNTRQERFVLRRNRPDIRERVAELYLHGEGLEIGALDSPLRLPEGARARYVDRLNMAELRKHYPGLDLIDIDIIDVGEHLASVPPGSQAFIVANHFLEHCLDPIGTLGTLASRLKSEGVLYMAVPDADFTFDHERPSTTFRHLVEDHASGPEHSRVQHYREWASLVEGNTDATSADERLHTLMEMGYSVHFHVWRMHGLIELFARSIDDFGLPVSLELVMRRHRDHLCPAPVSGSLSHAEREHRG